MRKQHSSGNSFACWATVVLLCLGGGVAAEGQISGVSASSAGLSRLAGTNTLVTVVLKPNGVTDSNLRVLSADAEYFRVQDLKGERYTYRYSDVQEVRVQGGEVEAPVFDPNGIVTLSKDQRAVIERGLQRMRQLFDSAADQNVKLEAATLLAMEGSPEAQQGGKTYLLQLAQTNDLPTVLTAYEQLYLTGDESMDRSALGLAIQMGLESGDRRNRAQAAKLAGLYGEVGYTRQLVEMLDSRAADVGAPASLALARLGVRDEIPTLIGNLTHTNADMEAATVEGLIVFGGDEVIAPLKTRLSEAQGRERFNIARVLFALGVPEAKDALIDITERVPTQAHQALLILSAAGDEPSKRMLRQRMVNRQQPSTEGLMQRTEFLAAVIKGGDRDQVAALQEMLRTTDVEVEIAVCNAIATIGQKYLIVLLGASMESPEPAVAVAACRAALANGSPDYAKRLKEISL